MFVVRLVSHLGIAELRLVRSIERRLDLGCGCCGLLLHLLNLRLPGSGLLLLLLLLFADHPLFLSLLPLLLLFLLCFFLFLLFRDLLVGLLQPFFDDGIPPVPAEDTSAMLLAIENHNIEDAVANIRTP